MVLLVFFLFNHLIFLFIKYFLKLPLDGFNIDFIYGRYAIRSFCDLLFAARHSLSSGVYFKYNIVI